MSAYRLTRRASLLLPFLMAACGGEEPRYFKPLRYDYLRPIDLAVKTVDIDVRYAPSGTGSDISGDAPVNPLATLRQMGEDRLKPLGTSGRAVFSISEASLVRRDNLIRGTMDATVQILSDDGRPAAFAQARVTRDHTGRVDDLQQLLYDMVSGMMDDMNVELEHRIRTQLKTWLAEEVNAVPTPVDAAPLAPPPR